MTPCFNISSQDERRRGWDHARDVLVLPEFAGLDLLINACTEIDLMIIDHESCIEIGDFNPKQYLKIVALYTSWILAFFELLRQVVDSPYKKVSGFPVERELKNLKTQANWVRSAFAKLQVAGRKRYVLPSFTGLPHKGGMDYAVYDGDGNEIAISRRRLADDFLKSMERHPPPSDRFQRLTP